MNRSATDITLWDWRYGPIQAERVCADLLQVEGFKGIDPQCPLGGPDGRKDILCTRDGTGWVAAVYFPPTRSNSKDVREKFFHDLEGAARCHRDSFVFLTNQSVTPSERSILEKDAQPIRVELYHQERIRSILDSPKGYGLRLEYLRIPMTEEELYSLWSSLKDDITGRLTRQEGHILDLHRKVDEVLYRTMQSAIDLDVGQSSLDSSITPQLPQFPTADLHLKDILWIHRILCDEIPEANRGGFRNFSVWIGEPGSTPESARYTPPPPEKITTLLEDLISLWRNEYSKILKGAEKDRIAALSLFHHRFLSIHPLLDGNGRVARALLQQQVFELMGRRLKPSFPDDPATYFDALYSADSGDLGHLERLIKVNLE